MKKGKKLWVSKTGKDLCLINKKYFMIKIGSKKKSVVQSNKTSRWWIINETHKHNFSKWKLYGL